MYECTYVRILCLNACLRDLYFPGQQTSIALHMADKWYLFNFITIPRKMCLKCHWLPCKSVATNSCHGGCWDISWKTKKLHNMEETNKMDAILQYHLYALTKGGRQSSACLLRTEKPPWVLVSEAVSVLQNEWTLHLVGSGRAGSGLVTSLCCLWKNIGQKKG